MSTDELRTCRFDEWLLERRVPAGWVSSRCNDRYDIEET